MILRTATILLALLALPSFAQEQVEVFAQQKIWDYAAHNAFTSLVRLNGEWFCAFREGNKHASADGGIRILRSLNEEQWNVAARLADEHADLRDPKLTVTPDNRLMLTAAAATPGKVSHRTLVWFSDDGKRWSDPQPIGDDNLWLWSVTWHGGTAYGVGYSTDTKDGERFIRLYKSTDGVKWETVVDKMYAKGSPNESSLVFEPDGTARCLVRRDGEPNTALLGEAKPPYTNWKWQAGGVRIGGPAMLRTGDGTLIAVVRLYDRATRTSVCRVNPDDGTLTDAGLVTEGNVLWVSFYSSHEGKASIYFAKVFLHGGDNSGPVPFGPIGLYGPYGGGIPISRPRRSGR